IQVENLVQIKDPDETTTKDTVQCQDPARVEDIIHQAEGDFQIGDLHQPQEIAPPQGPIKGNRPTKTSDLIQFQESSQGEDAAQSQGPFWAENVAQIQDPPQAAFSIQVEHPAQTPVQIQEQNQLQEGSEEHMEIDDCPRQTIEGNIGTPM